MSDQQTQVLIGSLLGDACLEKNGSKVRLRVDHGGKQKEYVFWKYQVFKSLAAKEPRKLEVQDCRTGKSYIHWRFDTISCSQLTDIKGVFYKQTRKAIPANIAEILKSPLSLAVWYMDDGYNRKDCRGMHLNTQAYSLEEHKLLQKCLRRNFGLKTTIHRQRDKLKLYIPSVQREKFVSLIQPYVVPSMVNKLL